MAEELEQLGLTELIRLQERISQTLQRRFEQKLALVFSDIVGSTPYFARFGDEAGRRLQQRHFDLLEKALIQAEKARESARQTTRGQRLAATIAVVLGIAAFVVAAVEWDIPVLPV